MTTLRHLAVALALAGATAAAGQPFERRSLGGHPVCEASAAVVVPCPHVGGRCLLVADNEERTRLFVYLLGPSGPDVDTRRMLSLEPLLHDLAPDEREISDIEALARIDDAGVLVVASHSRNKRCNARKKRRRLLGVELASGGLVASRAWGYQSARRPTCKRLFGRRRGELAGQRREICAAIETAEVAADRAQDAGSVADCQAARPFNVEGAVTVDVAGAGQRVWLGLRAPLVGGEAVLLRLSDAGDEPRFDGTARVRLGGFGIRDLTVHWGWIWLVAGPPEDDTSVPFELWRFPVEALEDEAVIAPEPVSPLPNGAEGVAIDGTTAIVVMDGDEANDGAVACRADATYTTLPVSLRRSRPQ